MGGRRGPEGSRKEKDLSFNRWDVSQFCDHVGKEGTFSDEERYAKRDPSGDILGSAFSGLPKSTLWGMSRAAVIDSPWCVISGLSHTPAFSVTSVEQVEMPQIRGEWDLLQHCTVSSQSLSEHGRCRLAWSAMTRSPP